MNKLVVLGVLASCFVPGLSREPFKARPGSLSFLVYFPSRYRGICMGALISRSAAITAAVCVTSATSYLHDTRPINVVTGTHYRHPRRGIRVQVTKILLPNLSEVKGHRQYLMQKSAAVLLLKQIVPDVLAEVPLRPIDIDYLGDVQLTLQQECLMAGWHFFYKGDKIFPVHKFLLQRNLRAQFVNTVKKGDWCEALSLKFQKALTNLGFHGYFENTGSICVRDPDRAAQPCHGMYGAPLVCEGKAVGMMMAPDSQWTNCTGFSNIIHLFSSKYLKNFMTCISRLFDVETSIDWKFLKQSLYVDISREEYDYVPAVYDKVVPNLFGSSSTEEV
ncbi:granzyme H-like [Plodia interpunctella]|uniref:granzyme H-like n=1 Tax=Plodia interpunctella TaxID=58824 RepID=UPI002367FEC1|nr:granzyme H-like [Plodia interpunctella]